MSGRFSSKGQLTPESIIPEKLYFKIGEVSQLVGVQPHVLRYWEKEVSAIRPGKTASNQRRYRRKDVEVFREIRRLLYEEKFTLAGARKRLVNGERSDESPSERTRVEEPAPVEVAEPAQPAQMSLEFQDAAALERLLDIREGLVDLVRLAGEEL
jgi:DNA-binding transcriptional MerR regulator